jgi:hypothetical protein
LNSRDIEQSRACKGNPADFKGKLSENKVHKQISGDHLVTRQCPAAQLLLQDNLMQFKKSRDLRAYCGAWMKFCFKHLPAHSLRVKHGVEC